MTIGEFLTQYAGAFFGFLCGLGQGHRHRR